MNKAIKRLPYKAQKVLILIIMTVLATASILPLLGNTAGAASSQVTNRSLTISTAVASATGVSYSYTFTTVNAQSIQSIIFLACTTALGTCTAPTGLNINQGTSTLTGWTNNATNFTRVTVSPSGSCAAQANNQLCMSRTQAASEAAGAKTIALSSQTNPSGASCSSNPNCTFFIRISTYTDTAFATAGDYGTVASSTTQTLTINAAVQEVLSFCAGSTAVDDSNTTNPGTCATIAGTSVNLGTLQSSGASITPVASGVNCSASDCAKNGITMLQTNAVNGASVTYKAVQASTGTNHLGGLRVTGAACLAGTGNTDQCIDSKTTQGALANGAEGFGVTVAGTNCVATTAYTCSFTGGTNNLKAVTGYIGATSTTYGTSTGFKWDESGAANQIASSTTVVDNEALILKFAAENNIATPTGSYSAQADFIAIPTY